MKRRSRFHAAIALLGTAIMVSPLAAMPTDIISNPAPTIGADPPKGIEVGVGDATVSGQTGSFSYSYPIEVPPGRNGMAPSLSLKYSSQQPLYGDIAAGWTLGIPVIKRDRSHGFLGGERWTSSLAGGRELVPVSEPKPANVIQSYRAQGDSSYARYQQMDTSVDHLWQVLTTDGEILRFGSRTLGGQSDWHQLMSREDAFGNVITYIWQGVGVPGPTSSAAERRLVSIRYTQYEPTPQLGHAQIDFTYEGPIATCNGAPIGAVRDVLESGVARYRGASKLIEIKVSARPTPSGSLEEVRRYQLIYNASSEQCAGDHAPVRQIKQIWELAEGQSEPELPPVTFTYGDLTRQLSTSYSVSGVANAKETIGWGQRRTNYNTWATMRSQLLDVNLDGRPDRLTAVAAYDLTYEHDRCEIRWKPNTKDVSGGVSLGAEQVSGGPYPIPWQNANFDLVNLGTMGAGEDCSLTGQYSLYEDEELHGPSECSRPNMGHYDVYRFLDITGDSIPDLVTALHYDPAYYWPTYTAPPLQAAVTGCAADVDPQCVDNAYDDQTQTWNMAALDACIAAVTPEACFYAGMEAAPPSDAAGQPITLNLNNIISQQCNSDPISGLTFCRPARVDVCKATRRPLGDENKSYRWKLHKGNPDGTFEPAVAIWSPIPLSPHNGAPTTGGGGTRESAQTSAIIDLDGDGYLDVVSVTNKYTAVWQVWFGRHGKFPWLGSRSFRRRRCADRLRLARTEDRAGGRYAGPVARAPTGRLERDAPRGGGRCKPHRLQR